MTEISEKGTVYYFNKQTVKSYWQPKPANGHVTVAVSPEFTPMERDFSLGTQTLPPGGRVREHAHPGNEEILHFISGRGQAIIDGKEYVLEPGVTVFLGKHNSHTFLNNGTEDLHWVWFMTPSGLEGFFRDIGRPRTEGEPAPEPFDRPENIEQIESSGNGVFAYTKN
ncbi:MULTISPECIES: cupin domain-containing protein [unclassified Acinetobacter]|uniref:cupin domain-containing protein n=2 Tax=Acinetobacter TaxID=469 RepID=UPI000DD0E1BF|nr:MULTISPECIES: cupin domain-containing protein [unclassified Acinetobacter]MCG2574837.1 cupin domain-containing protein [Acinetobacter sp. ME22]